MAINSLLFVKWLIPVETNMMLSAILAIKSVFHCVGMNFETTVITR